MIKNQQRIAVIFPYSLVDTTPVLMNTIILLARNGYAVELFTIQKPGYFKPKFVGHDITSHILFTGFKSHFLFKYIPLRLVFSFFCGCRIFFRKYKCLIGVDPEGVVIAHTLRLFTRSPIVYFSLEVWDPNNLNGWRSKLIKRLERTAYRNSVFAIALGEKRAKLLSQTNNISGVDMILMPNSPLGRAKRRESRFLHTRFSIPEEKIIILTAGAFVPQHLVEELVVAAEDWPDEWILVVHSKSVEDSPVDYTRRILSKAAHMKNKVILSLQPVPYNELEMLFASAHIGIALYTFQNRNVSTPDMGSGKMIQHLHLGCPVILSDVPSLRTFIDNYRCGVCVKDVSEVQCAIKIILSRYDEFIENAIECYNETFLFDKFFKNFLERIYFL